MALVDAGATGAVARCLADHAPELWDRPPCRDFRHECFCGFVRLGGALKPHVAVLQQFAATRPRVNPAPPHVVDLGVPRGDHYRAPRQQLIERDRHFQPPARHAEVATVRFPLPARGDIRPRRLGLGGGFGVI